MDTQLYCANCFDILPSIKDASIGFICIDLPYSTTAVHYDRRAFDLDGLWKELKRVIMPDRAIAMFASGSFAYRLAASNIDELRYELIWVKTKRTNFINAKNRPLSAHEKILIFSNGATANGCHNPMLYNPQNLVAKRNVHNGKNGMGTLCYNRPSQKDWVVSEYTNYPIDVLEFESESGINHPNAKPVPLLEYLIRTYSNEGDTVLDCCMGSGSCGVAAVRSNRKFIGIELDPTYFELGCQRIENEQKKLRLF